MKQINTKKAVLWDMDGVIADTGQCHFESWQLAFKKQDINFTAEDFRHIFGKRNDTIIKEIAGKDFSPDKVEEIANDKEEIFRARIRQNLKSFPGVIHLLRTLKDNNIVCAIASSTPLENINLILEGLRIEGCFQAIVYGQEVTEGKPSPQVFLLAARKLGVEPGNCIVIEDAVAGVTAARRAAMRCIAVTNTHEAIALAEADLVVDSLEKIGLKELNSIFNSAN